MSRVILSVNDDNSKTMRVVVGWDRPLQTFFWQVFAPEPPIDKDTGYPYYPNDYEEVEGYGGYVPREIERAEFLKTFAGIPDEVKDLISDEVLRLLNELHVHQDTQFNHQVWLVDADDGSPSTTT